MRARPDLRTAARLAIPALAQGFDDCGRDPDSVWAEPLKALRLAMREPDGFPVVAGAATALAMLEPGHGSPAYRGDPPPVVALQQEAERMGESALQEAGRRLVGQEVRYCVSSLVSALLQTAFEPDALVDEDDARALAGRAPGPDEYREAEDYADDGLRVEVMEDEDGAGWCWRVVDVDDGEEMASGEADDEDEAWQEAWRETSRDDPEGAEAFEHWLVTDWLGRMLRERGESVVDDVQGLTIWARCTTGQAISMDSVVRDIARGWINAGPVPSAEDVANAAQSLRNVEQARQAVAYPGDERREFVEADEAGREAAAAALADLEPNAAAVFAVACASRFGFDPRDGESSR